MYLVTLYHWLSRCVCKPWLETCETVPPVWCEWVQRCGRWTRCWWTRRWRSSACRETTRSDWFLLECLLIRMFCLAGEKKTQNRIRTRSPVKVKCGATLASVNGLCGCCGYLGPISTSFCPLPFVSFGSSDSGSICSGGRNNQRTTSFCSALRLLQPVWERPKNPFTCVKLWRSFIC